MKKVTEIKETRYRTVHEKDAFGNRKRKKVAYTGFRAVKLVSGGKRFAGFFVDTVVFRLIIYSVTFFLAFVFAKPLVTQDEVSILFFSLGLFILCSYPAYYFLFEAFSQKTPGKFLCRTRVIDEYNNKPSTRTILLRTIIRLVPFEIFSCLEGRGWHDRWSDTYVITDEEYQTLKQLLSEEQVLSTVPSGSLDSVI